MPYFITHSPQARSLGLPPSLLVERGRVPNDRDEGVSQNFDSIRNETFDYFYNLCIGNIYLYPLSSLFSLWLNNDLTTLLLRVTNLFDRQNEHHSEVN